jgi:hypothetical protein
MVRAKRKPMSHITHSPECKKMWGSEPSHSQGQLSLREMESWWTPKILESDLRGQNSMACGVLYIIGNLLQRRYLKWARIAHLDIWNTNLWPKERSGVKLPIWLPTRKRRESTQFTCLQTACDIPLESSWQELQLCLRLHLDPRSSRKVMGLQSCESPHWHDFGTPIRESRERKVI